MNIIVTGASSGIGYELAGAFARGGNKVFVIARQSVKLKKLASENPEGSIIPVTLDLATYEYKELDTALEAHRVDHIDILVHNAGYLINKPFADLSSEDWEYTFKVNVIGVALLTRVLLSRMGGEKATHIVMIGSIGGINGSLKFPGLSAYSSSKGALGVLAEMLAEEFKGKNVFVNCLALGSVQTEMLEKAFPGYRANMTSREISGFIFNFCVEGWRYINGKILPISGGNP